MKARRQSSLKSTILSMGYYNSPCLCRNASVTLMFMQPNCRPRGLFLREVLGNENPRAAKPDRKTSLRFPFFYPSVGLRLAQVGCFKTRVRTAPSVHELGAPVVFERILTSTRQRLVHDHGFTITGSRSQVHAAVGVGDM